MSADFQVATLGNRLPLFHTRSLVSFAALKSRKGRESSELDLAAFSLLTFDTSRLSSASLRLRLALHHPLLRTFHHQRFDFPVGLSSSHQAPHLVDKKSGPNGWFQKF